MRILALAFLLLTIPSAALAQGQTKTPSKQANDAFEAANAARNVCLVKWMRQLAVSTDPIEHVANAVSLECQQETNKTKLTAREVFPNMPFGDISRSFDDGQRKTILASLVRFRVEAKTGGAAGISTGSISSETSEERAKTREGATAECDRDDAEYRKWVAERGHVRVAIIEERVENDRVCRQAAKKLPTAAEYHSQRN